MAAASLPLFPLPLVLFPGAPMPLHVFEPRYRTMLSDVQARDGRFGIIAVLDGESDGALPTGRVGCVAELRDVRMLPDGRADILVEGTRRFAFGGFVDSAKPYHVARVADYDDELDDDVDALDDAADLARTTFGRIVTAAATMANEAAAMPELPDEPAELAFRIASLVDFAREECQAILVQRSALARLRAVEALLRGALPEIEERARVHGRARSNGHGPRNPLGTS